MEPEFSFRISDSKSRIIPTWFLVLPALYFTMKGVKAILKSNIILAHYQTLFLLYCSDSKFNCYYSYPKENPLFLPCTANLFRWLECVTGTIWLWNQNWIYNCDCLCNFGKRTISAFSDKVEMRWWESKKKNILIQYTSVLSQMVFLSFNLLWQPTDVSTL